MPTVDTGLLCPLDLTVDSMVGMLNAKFADHPVYDSVELQWFDDSTHGSPLMFEPTSDGVHKVLRMVCTLARTMPHTV
ncbi:MAG TPA: hypothetical protein VMM13_03755 [Euzebya sp.]|nr:hypothetical protein [Euzebya sp.]